MGANISQQKQISYVTQTPATSTTASTETANEKAKYDDYMTYRQKTLDYVAIANTELTGVMNDLKTKAAAAPAGTTSVTSTIGLSSAYTTAATDAKDASRELKANYTDGTNIVTNTTENAVYERADQVEKERNKLDVALSKVNAPGTAGPSDDANKLANAAFYITIMWAILASFLIYYVFVGIDN